MPKVSSTAFYIPPERFKEIRKKLNMTQAEFAFCLGLGDAGQITVCRLERGAGDYRPSGSACMAAVLLERLYDLHIRIWGTADGFLKSNPRNLPELAPITKGDGSR